MSSRSLRRVSAQDNEDMDLVQNLMANCLQQYMSRKETVEKLLHEAKIDPLLTEITWQTLEQENKEFFRAYYTKLALKQQMEEFNRLLEKQMQHHVVQPLSHVVASQDPLFWNSNSDNHYQAISYPEITEAFCRNDNIAPPSIGDLPWGSAEVASFPPFDFQANSLDPLPRAHTGGS